MWILGCSAVFAASVIVTASLVDRTTSLKEHAAIFGAFFFLCLLILGATT